MKFRIPFAGASLDKARKRAAYFKRYIKHKKESKIKTHLENAGIKITREEYLAICLSGFVSTFVSILVVSSTFLILLKLNNALLVSLGISTAFAFFVLFARLMYPKLYSSRKQKEMEGNLLPALDDMLVQLNSGVPLFNILVNISSSDYGSLSDEFKKIVRQINAGIPEAEVLEQAGEKNPSIFFRRTLWQISNGMKAGSDISIIVKDSINSLSEEQLIQIQEYGNKLNPMIMFYMLVSVILPALSITFLTVISSLINLERGTTISIFIALFVGVMMAQVMFLGIIKSIRPSLL